MRNAEPQVTCLQNMNQAVAVLDATKHWRIQSENSSARGRYYSCKIWANGRRVEATARTPLMAVEAALQKLKEPRRRKRKTEKPKLSIIG